MFDRIRQFLADNPRLPLIVGAALLAGVIVVWGVWGGFSLEIGRFFAAEPTVCTYANRNAPECACALNRAVGTACHVCTKPFQEGNTDYPDAQWFAWDDLRLCDATCPARFPYRTERTKKEGGAWAGTESCVEKPPDCPAGYHAFGDTLCEADVLATSIPTPTTSVSPSGAASLSVQCGTTQNVLTWTLVAGRDSNSLLRGVDGGDSTWICGGPDGIPPCTNLAINSFTDTNVAPGHIYSYSHKSCVAASCRSNTVVCPSATLSPTLSPTPFPTPTSTPLPTSTISPTPAPSVEPSPTPAPQPGESLLCTPGTQTVAIGEIAYFFAFGGDGVRYGWDAGTSAIQEEDEGFPGSAAFSWTTRGTKVVTVRSGGDSSTCVVEVLDPNATPPPAPGPTGPVVVIKQARNTTLIQTAFREAVSVQGGQRLEFSVRLTEREGDGAQALVLHDTLPPGMSYITGSTTIDGDPAGDGIAFGGLEVPPFPAGAEHRVLWSAVADRVGELPAGPQVTQPAAVAEVFEDGENFTPSDTVSVTVFGTGTSLGGGAVGGAGAVPTGPGEAVLMALTLAVVGSLLYAAHTRSAGFRRHEVEQVSQDQGPMDFRS